MSQEPAAAWSCQEGESPVVAVALHAGHDVRDEVAGLLALDEGGRLVEEDPWTDAWVALGGTRIVVHRSRFEVDLNRPRDRAVYVRPDQAWGLQVWRQLPPADVVERSLRIHDDFYAMLDRLLARAAQTFGRFVVYDLHSYNHRRSGPAAPPADPAENPDVNLGTGSMDRDRWAAVVDRFLADLANHEPHGRPLDVRENVRFKGGHLCQWVHESFPTGCALAIEVKKFFMDEHTGRIDPTLVHGVGEALAATVPGVVEELGRS